MNNFKVCDRIEKESGEMRKAFCQVLIDLAKEDPRIVLLDADLMGAMGTKPFQKEFPERTIDCGVQEANTVGMACGLSIEGKVPFVHTFGPFVTRRAADQVFISGAYNKANVKLIGSDPGITASYNGGTHMPFEDMGIMRGMPTMTIIEPTDIAMLRDIVKQVAGIYGMFYLRLVRKGCMKVYEDGSTFEIGKAALLRDGTDATVIASGYCVAEALSAADMLAAEGISVRVLNMFTWKPIDEAAIKAAAAETGAIITAENHNVINGLGSAVAEVLVKNKPCPVEMVGVQDEFGEVGPESYLRERFNLTDNDIAAAVKKAIARK
ncbi:MAG: transketolase family protein [Oscillospiraceae bacterium]|nr:transketolase family protein [Oscillospiraceae bacterium]